MAFFIAIGHDPREITVAIVNDEIPYWADCLNMTKPNVYYDSENFECNFNTLSCKYIKSLDETIIVKEFYSTLDEAKNAVRKGRALAALHISHNFTNAMKERSEDGRGATEETIDNSIVKLWLDMSNHQLAYFLKQKMYKDYKKFSRDLFTDCQYSPRLADIPIYFDDPVFGHHDSSYTEFMVPGIMITVIFFLSTTATSTIVITDKLEGVWDRTIVAGVKSGEILTVHVFIQTLVLVVQTIEILMIVFLFNQVSYNGDIVNIAILLFLQGVTGMCFGFLVSVVCDTYTVAFYLSTGTFYPMILLCGIVWPIEGMDLVVKYFSMTLPFTIPIKSMRQIIEKGFLFTNIAVYDGYIVSIVWIVSLLLACYVILKNKRK